MNELITEPQGKN